MTRTTTTSEAKAYHVTARLRRVEELAVRMDRADSDL